MGWKIVEVETGDNMNLFLDNIVIYKDNEKIILPIKDIDVLLVNNTHAKLSVPLINCLSENNVLTILCDSKYLPTCNILPIIGNFNTLKILEQQTKWTNEFKGKMWQTIIKLKIQNQLDFAKYVLKNEKLSTELFKLLHEVKEFDITNREGHAAKIFWHALFGIKWNRFDDDYVNKVLNYGYTILRSYFARSIIKKGLDPRIAFFHKSFSNYFALASDLMEPFRIIIDHLAYQIHLEKTFNFYNDKQRMVEVFNNKIKIGGKYQFISNAIDIFVDCIVKQTDLPEISYEFK